MLFCSGEIIEKLLELSREFNFLRVSLIGYCNCMVLLESLKFNAKNNSVMVVEIDFLVLSTIDIKIPIKRR